MKFGLLVQLAKGNILRYGCIAAAPPDGRWRHLLVSSIPLMQEDVSRTGTYILHLKMIVMHSDTDIEIVQ